MFRILFLILFIPMSSHAAACCASATATAFDVGRLLKWEPFAVGIRTSYDTKYLSKSALWALVAITPQISVFGILPWSLGTTKNTKGFDDVQLGARYQFSNLGIIGSIIFPSGVSSESSWGFSLAAALEKSWQPFFAQLNLGTTGFLPTGYNGSEHSFWKGVRGQLAGVAGMELPYDLIATLTVQYILKTASYLDGDEHLPLENKFPISVGLSWKIDPNWMLISSISSDFTLLGGQIAIRYGYF